MNGIDDMKAWPLTPLLSRKGSHSESAFGSLGRPAPVACCKTIKGPAPTAKARKLRFTPATHSDGGRVIGKEFRRTPGGGEYRQCVQAVPQFFVRMQHLEPFIAFCATDVFLERVVQLAVDRGIGHHTTDGETSRKHKERLPTIELKLILPESAGQRQTRFRRMDDFTSIRCVMTSAKMLFQSTTSEQVLARSLRSAISQQLDLGRVR